MRVLVDAWIVNITKANRVCEFINLLLASGKKVPAALRSRFLMTAIAAQINFFHLGGHFGSLPRIDANGHHVIVAAEIEVHDAYSAG